MILGYVGMGYQHIPLLNYGNEKWIFQKMNISSLTSIIQKIK